MILSTADPESYVQQDDQNRMIGITGSYVDDVLNAENNSFEKLTERTLNHFDRKPQV